ncbi:hypothetical protein HanRHA438_Chr04g0195561 [Helianthus annuus]|nr:hypothetical protein HanOQP8_Chr04g0163991 [Helianthus annuus]KAJ0928570.1 hypothetical protein HanRHA438_Chr04g0195561 [Helianthus annuus]
MALGEFQKKKRIVWSCFIHVSTHLCSHFYEFCVKQRKIETPVRGRKGDSEKRGRSVSGNRFPTS